MLCSFLCSYPPVGRHVDDIFPLLGAPSSGDREHLVKTEEMKVPLGTGVLSHTER